jgi:hypothetical protein
MKGTIMNRGHFLRWALLALTAVTIIGCASTPGEKAKAAREEGAPVVFDQPIAATQQAAVNALTVIGCDIKRREATYLEGHRSNKIGVTTGSGGETVKIWLTATEPQKTSVKVQTRKSLVGSTGQKNWDAQVLDEMTKALGQ